MLALWAAVIGAFVSVIYRRQGDADAARARDLKLVYDLQLDREISARREYELTVEAQIRRDLASELRSQSADEVAALRAELAALRNNLEILFDTELAQRPAIETDRTTVRAYSDWTRETETTDPGRGSASRLGHEVDVDTGEDRIIDVPEEPLGRPQSMEEPLGRRYSMDEPASPDAADFGLSVGAGAHRLPSENGSWAAPPAAEPQREPPTSAANTWNPAPAEGQWLPPGAPGGNWVSAGNGFSAAHAAAPEPTPEPPHGRHAGPPEGTLPPPAPAPQPPEEPAADDRVPVETPTRNSQHGEGQGQSVAELLARMRATPTAGGRRRRREN
jgi:hypothetical protein